MTATRIVVLDPNEDALALTGDWGADETVLVDGKHVDRVLELTDGKGAEVVLDFVGERGAERDSWTMTHRAGSDFVIGYGGTVDIPTIDVISTERNVVGNLVGSYNDLVELMALNAAGRVTMLTGPTRWTRSTTPWTTSTPADCAAAASWSPQPGITA